MAYRKILAVNISRDKTGTQQEYGDIFRLMLSIALPVILSTALYNLIELVDGSLFNNIMASKGMEDVKVKIRYDAGPAVVVDHLPDRSLTVFQQSHVFGQRDHPAFKENFARERLFKMCSIHRFVPVLPCAVQRMIL